MCSRVTLRMKYWVKMLRLQKQTDNAVNVALTRPENQLLKRGAPLVEPIIICRQDVTFCINRCLQDSVFRLFIIDTLDLPLTSTLPEFLSTCSDVLSQQNHRHFFITSLTGCQIHCGSIILSIILIDGLISFADRQRVPCNLRGSSCAWYDYKCIIFDFDFDYFLIINTLLKDELSCIVSIIELTLTSTLMT